METAVFALLIVSFNLRTVVHFHSFCLTFERFGVYSFKAPKRLVFYVTTAKLKILIFVDGYQFWKY